MCVSAVVSDSVTYGLQPARLLCLWDSPGKNTGMACHALLQGIFLTQGSNPCLLRLLHWQVGYLPLSFQEVILEFKSWKRKRVLKITALLKSLLAF